MSLFVDIEKKLGDFQLKVNFETGNTDVLALLGASGCGKSMTLKCIAGIERPDRGKVILDGRTLFDSDKRICLPPQKRRVGYLFQQYALFPNMNVAKNIACGVRGRDGSEKWHKVNEMIKIMNLEGEEKKKPHQLSGGQQQRVALARILVNEPDVLLLDEPFSALDSHLRFKLEAELRRVIEKFGKSVILVSHDRDEVFRISSHIAIMKDGKLETIGERHQVFARPETPNGAKLTGCKNVSPARKLDENRLFAENWGLTLRFDPGRQVAFTHIGIRMHEMFLYDESMEETDKFYAIPPENVIKCHVEEVIENPFSYTLMLRPEGEEPRENMGIELDKNVWQARRNEYVRIGIPSEAVLLLKE